MGIIPCTTYKKQSRILVTRTLAFTDRPRGDPGPGTVLAQLHISSLHEHDHALGEIVRVDVTPPGLFTVADRDEALAKAVDPDTLGMSYQGMIRDEQLYSILCDTHAPDAAMKQAARLWEELVAHAKTMDYPLAFHAY